MFGIIRSLASFLSHLREEEKQQSKRQQCLCMSVLFIFSARPLGHQSQLALVEKQFNEACKSHAPNQGACLCARLSRWGPPPQSDLIAEYISHPGENERFTVTGRPRSSEEPWAGINLDNPARWFVKEQMDPQLFALSFMCGLDCVGQGAPLVMSRDMFQPHQSGVTASCFFFFFCAQA